MSTNLKSNLNAEEKLALALCSLDFDDNQKDEISELLKGITDWDRYIQLVNEHGVIALEAYNLRELRLADLLPAHVREVLDNARMKILLRNTWLTGRWKEINAILSAAGIKHVVLKGMALEHTIYRSLGLRQMTDTDILVKRDDALKAWNLLQQHGFAHEPIKSPLHKKIILEIGKHLPTLIKDGYQVEIHHRLFRKNVSNDLLPEAIDNAGEFSIDGISAYMLNKELHLKFLHEHFEYHLKTTGPHLKQYLDMVLLDPDNPPLLPDGFISRSLPHGNSSSRNKVYRDFYQRLPSSARLRYLAGDIFPSHDWMKRRYSCGALKASLLYLPRIGIVFRVI